MPIGKIIGAGAEATINTAASYYASKKNQKAVNKSADQLRLAEENAIARRAEQQQLAEGQLSPYSNFGISTLPELANMNTQQGQIDYLQNSPIFQASLKNMNDQVLNNAAVRGRLNAGDTRQRFADNFQAAALPLLSYQSNNLFNAAQLGAGASGQLSSVYTNYGNTQAEGEQTLGNINAGQIMGVQGAKNKFYQDAIAAHSKFADTFQSAYGGSFWKK